MSRRYRYTADDSRYYPDIALQAEPGETYELAKNPDESRFEFVKPKPAKREPAPPVAEPTEPAPTPDTKES